MDFIFEKVHRIHRIACTQWSPHRSWANFIELTAVFFPLKEKVLETLAVKVCPYLNRKTKPNQEGREICSGRQGDMLGTRQTPMQFALKLNVF